jgi:predicted class III extradiol MEMO1 family dioxygenase
MAKIVAALAAAHDPLITAAEDVANPKQRSRIMHAFSELRSVLEASKPDVLVVFGTDHMNTFFLDNMPAFCIGIGPECMGPNENWLKIPAGPVPIDQSLARYLLEGLMEKGFDLSFAQEMPLDHAFMVPIHLLTPRRDLPIVPIFTNCAAPPLPTAKRCYQIGMALGELIGLYNSEVRVALLGTGGLSHWVGTPETGKINEPFDRRVLDLFCRGDGETLAAYTDPMIEEAGNGAHEIRNWITLLGAVRGKRGRVLAYEPIAPWITGVGLGLLDVEA